FAAIICYILTLVIADVTARKFQTFYKDMDGISIPQPFCAGFVPFASALNKVLDKIPGMDRLEIDAEGLKKKFGLLGEPLFLGVVVGIVIGCLTCTTGTELVDKIPYILGLGIKMGAVMELIPRVTVLFIEGLRPISEATRQLIARKFKGADGLNIGMTPALVIGHPTTLVVSILLIPVTLVLAVVLPGNQFLPLASLAGMFYIFPLVLPYTKGSVVKTFIIGLVVLTLGLYMVTNLAPAFTLAAKDVYAATQDAAVAIPAGFEGGSLDFASSPLAWVIYQCTMGLKWIGAGLLVILTLVTVIWNRVLIIRNQKAMAAKGADTIQTTE
ncbi:MAG: PTS sugar transporter subunit IIC, partial [Duncaniella sp.]|nr:PTS sugar transporter subunit IIC [Duncaniella sp.]